MKFSAINFFCLLLLISVPSYAAGNSSDLKELQSAATGGDAKALAAIKSIAEGGNTEAQNWLGGLFLNGSGVKEDDAAATNWFHKAADRGDMEGQYNLGLIYANGGYGVKQDLVQSYMWFILAGKAGHDGSTGQLERITPTMTQEQITEAKSLAAAWKPAVASDSVHTP